MMLDFITFVETHSASSVIIVILLMICSFLFYVVMKHLVFKKMSKEFKNIENKLDAATLAIEPVKNIKEMMEKNVKDPCSTDGAIYHRDLLKKINDVKKFACSDKCPNMALIIDAIGDSKRDLENEIHHVLDRLGAVEKSTDTIHSRIDNWTARLIDTIQRVGGRRDHDE